MKYVLTVIRSLLGDCGLQNINIGMCDVRAHVCLNVNKVDKENVLEICSRFHYFCGCNIIAALTYLISYKHKNCDSEKLNCMSDFYVD